jgi:hypothetical protein
VVVTVKEESHAVTRSTAVAEKGKAARVIRRLLTKRYAGATRLSGSDEVAIVEET